jgi:hypothetical protein
MSRRQIHALFQDHRYRIGPPLEDAVDVLEKVRGRRVGSPAVMDISSRSLTNTGPYPRSNSVTVPGQIGEREVELLMGKATKRVCDRSSSIRCSTESWSPVLFRSEGR